MAKFCPILNRKVVYLDCLECDDKQCEHPKIKTKQEEKGEQNKCHSTMATQEQTISE